MAHHHDSSFRSLVRYEEYYLAGGDLFFMVDHHMFRVHRYFFERESSYFKGKLATPASPGATRQGTSESNAIVIDDVKAHEFARFLWVFYNPKYSLYNASVADWVAILNLSHRWAFPEVKELAVRELEKQPMGDVDRVVVYQDNNVNKNLLIPCYAALCERDEPLTAQEGRRMGIETSLTIAHLREMARRSPTDCRSPAPATFHGHDLQSLVRELFEIPAPLEDDVAPVTPLGGPSTPHHQKPRTGSQSQSMDLPLPQETPVQTQPPVNTAPARPVTPPLQPPLLPQPMVPVQAPLTAPQLPPPPTPPKPERPQVQTAPIPALGKVKQTGDQSRPSTPALETPGPETPSQGTKPAKTKKVKKAKKEETPVTAAAAGSKTPKVEEKEQSNGTGTDEVSKPTEAGEKDKVEGLTTTELDKGEKDTGSQETQKEAGSSTAAAAVAASVGGPIKANGSSTTDGVSTDSTAADTTTSDGNAGATHPLGSKNPFSPGSSTKQKADVLSNADFLKSPQEKVKSPGLLGTIWDKTGFSS